MAGEILVAYGVTAKVLYAIVRNSTGSVWQTTTSTFVTYATANLANYTIAMTEQGTASGVYAGTFPAAAAGVYSVTSYVRAGGSAAETDPVAGTGEIQWDGSAVVSLQSRMATYTQPTGFLAATFPTTVASTTNITAGTITNVGTLTTYTGNTPQTGDSFARIGAAGVSLTALASASALATVQSDTDNIQTRLPAALVGGKMDSTGTVTGSVTLADGPHGGPSARLQLAASGLVPGLLLQGSYPNGETVTDFGLPAGQWNGGDVQSDGKIVAVGFAFTVVNDPNTLQPILGRYLTNGTLDPSFGQGGRARLVLPGGDNQLSSAAVQTDGKIVVCGKIQPVAHDWPFQGLVARFNSDGTLDTTYGTNGMTVVTHGSDRYVPLLDIALQADGKAVAVGASGDLNSVNDFLVCRLLTDGTLDPSFGAGGVTTSNFGAVDSHGFNVCLQSDQKILVTGWTGQSTATARYTTLGALDATFGTGGRVITDVSGGPDFGHGVAVQGDGKVVVTGVVFDTPETIVVLRYSALGVLDATFGTGGIVKTVIPGADANSFGIAVQADQKLVVVGASTLGPFAARYTTLGVLDATFGTSGVAVLPALGFGANERTHLIFQPDEYVIVLGGVFTDALLAQYVPYVARLDADGVLDTTFGAGGPGLQLRSPGTPVLSVVGPQEITGGTTILAAVGSGLSVFSLDGSPAITGDLSGSVGSVVDTVLANIVAVNGIDVDGAGTTLDPWGPA